MSAHPIEALLRPPVELWSALVAVAAAAFAWLAPWALMMPPGVATSAGAGLALISLVRGRQAWRVIRYQRNMRRLPTYTVRANQAIAAAAKATRADHSSTGGRSKASTGWALTAQSHAMKSKPGNA